MSNIVEEFLGLGSEEHQISPEEKEKALAIVRLTQLPDWKVFQNFLVDELKKTDQPCEVYAAHPDEAWKDVGKKTQLILIQQFIDTQIKLIEQYVEEKTGV